MSYDSASEIQHQQVFGEFCGVNPSITDSSTFTFLKPDTMKELFENEIEGCFKDYSEYDKFNEPQISYYSSQNMLVYEIEGTPNVTAGIAISELYKSFYKIKNEYSLKSNPPHVRSMPAYDIPKDKWIGKYALPRNKNVTSLLEELKDSFFLRFEKWEGSDYLELLHVGKYENINLTSNKLENYISKNGYVINGFHEEIYIKGPGMFFKGNPEKYLTLIRYTIKKLN